MNKSYKYRCYPNASQKILLAKTFGCCRFVYNYFLDKAISNYKQNNISYNYYVACKELTALKCEYEWLREPDKCALQNALKDLGVAYKRFFNGNGFPKFKSKKDHRYSYRTQNSNNGRSIQVSDNKIRIPKVGWLRIRDKEVRVGNIINATISQSPSGKYFISVSYLDLNDKSYNKTGCSIGIDVGIKDFAITSNGDRFANNKYLKKSLSKLAKLQRELSRKTRGSSNRNKARIKVARQYEKIANQRRDFMQKLTTKLIKENDIICVEDLAIKKMIQDSDTNLSRNIVDASWFEFYRELQYKANWYDKKIIKIDRYFASSQTCHVCGCKSSTTKDLSIRHWKCQNCGSVLDRDINAAINILNQGLNITL